MAHEEDLVCEILRFHPIFRSFIWKLLGTWNEFSSLCIVFKNLLRTINLQSSYPWSFTWCLELSIYMFSVIFRVLVQDVLSGSSSYARFRSRGMLVIAHRGYLSVFGPKILHLKLLFLSLKDKNRNLSSLPHPLELISAHSPPQSILPTLVWLRCCMLEALGDLEDCKPTLFLSPCFLILVERSSPTLCLCVHAISVLSGEFTS